MIEAIKLWLLLFVLAVIYAIVLYFLQGGDLRHIL